jgi:hypothetical protein
MAHAIEHFLQDVQPVRRGRDGHLYFAVKSARAAQRLVNCVEAIRGC